MKKDELQKEIGYLIRHSRRNAEMTQKQLSEQIDVGVSYMCEIEKGNKAISTWLLYKIEKHIGPVWSERI